MPDHTHDPRTPAGRAALRACPFCGSEARLTSTVDGMENDIPAVICNGCSAEMPGFKPLTAEQTVAQWNRRDERDRLVALLRDWIALHGDEGLDEPLAVRARAAAGGDVTVPDRGALAEHRFKHGDSVRTPWRGFVATVLGYLPSGRVVVRYQAALLPDIDFDESELTAVPLKEPRL